jgi:hypothetical protein
LGRDQVADQQQGADDDALHVKVENGHLDIGATQGGLQAVERGWEFTLTWYGNNPAQGDVILLFFLAIALIWARKSRQTAQMNQQYKDALRNSEQPQLPLPDPDKK